MGRLVSVQVFAPPPFFLLSTQWAGEGDDGASQVVNIEETYKKLSLETGCPRVLGKAYKARVPLDQYQILDPLLANIRGSEARNFGK
jgi:hypothetical protein